MRFLSSVAFFFAVAFNSVSAPAATYTVDPEGTGDFPTIQAAIDAAVSGDIIELLDGQFGGPGNRDIDFLGKAVAVRSQSGDPEACIINCGGSEAEPHRGFHFHSLEQTDSVIEGVTIKNGWADVMPHAGGGAVLCENSSSPTIRSCVFHDNQKSAVFCRDGSAASFTDCVFMENGGDQGGAIDFLDAYSLITGCDFSNNSVVYSGGAIHGQRCDLDVRECTFTGNTASNSGAINLIYSCTLLAENCVFRGNWTFVLHASAVTLHGFVTGTFNGCTFVGNGDPTQDRGYVVASSKMSHMYMTGCTFWGNSANAVVACGELDGIFDNVIIAFSRHGRSLEGDDVVLSCCDFYGNPGGDWEGSIADQFGINGNISKDPLFCDPENGDFTIRSDSPCAPFSPPNEECDLIGAWPVACFPPTATRATTWGRVKVGLPSSSGD